MAIAGCRAAAPTAPAVAPSSQEAASSPSHGVAVGSVAAGDAVAWTRCPGAQAARFELQRGEDVYLPVPAALASLRVVTRMHVAAEGDFTAKTRLAGLEPATEYVVHAVCEPGAAGGGEPDRERGAAREPPASRAVAVFRTAPDAADPAPVRIAWSGDLGGQNVCRCRAGRRRSAGSTSASSSSAATARSRCRSSAPRARCSTPPSFRPRRRRQLARRAGPRALADRLDSQRGERQTGLVASILAPLIAGGAFVAYVLITTWLGIFRPMPWEYLALSVAGAALGVWAFARRPGLWRGASAALSVALTGGVFWMIFVGSMLPAREDRPAVGDRFPDFALRTSTGGTFRLSEATGRRHLIVLYRGDW
jgi:uncharacterized membrane protein YeaQ/YmgE (transglycosylase-associated protein family)